MDRRHHRAPNPRAQALLLVVIGAFSRRVAGWAIDSRAAPTWLPTHSAHLTTRAQAAGYEALILTVDIPVAGSRLRELRNGFSNPPALTARTILEGATIRRGG